jgi:hypothetical protein
MDLVMVHVLILISSVVSNHPSVPVSNLKLSLNEVQFFIEKLKILMAIMIIVMVDHRGSGIQDSNYVTIQQICIMLGKGS